MIKLACCLTRRPEFIREHFQDYRVGAHAPLVGHDRDIIALK